MNKILIVLGVLAIAVVAASAAQQDVTVRDIAHPRLLEAALDNNFDELYAADVVLGTNEVAASRLSGNVAVARITNALGSAGANIGGNVPVAAVSNAVVGTYLPASSVGRFNVVGSTQLVFIAGSTTNVIDSDITTP